MAACAAAWSAPSLIAFRVLQGLGGGMLEPTMLTVLARAAGPTRSGRAMGLVSMPITLGPAIGPVLGGLLVDHLGWRWVFLINIPVGLVTVALSLRAVPAGDRGTARPLDLLGLCLVGPGFAALVYALSQAGAAGFTAPRVLVALALGAVLLLGYAVHALRTRRPALIDLHLFRYGRYTLSVAVLALLGAVLFSTFFLVPQYYQHVRGADARTAGLLLAPFGLGALVAMPLAGRLSDRIGPRALAPIGALAAALSTGVFALAGGTGSEIVLAVAIAVLGAGLGMIGAPTMGSVYRSVPAASAASATSTLYVLNQIGGALGIAVVTLTLGDAPGPDRYPPAFAVLAGLALAVAVATLALPGRRLATAATEPTGTPADVPVG